MRRFVVLLSMVVVALGRVVMPGRGTTPQEATPPSMSGPPLVGTHGYGAGEATGAPVVSSRCLPATPHTPSS